MAIKLATRSLRIVLTVILLAAAGCGDNDARTDATWGPLAVQTGRASGDEALIAGRLHVGEDCVVLEQAGDEQVGLLVWPSEGTNWNSEARVIRYSDGVRTVELSDGDRVSFGGGGDSADEGGLTADEWIDSVDWESEPDPSCPAEVRWFVGTLRSTRSANS